MGKLIVFEGIDGVGKTYWAKLISEYVDNSVYVTRKEMKMCKNEYVREVASRLESVVWNAPQDAPIELLTNEGWLHFHLAWYAIFQENVLRPLLEDYDIVFMDGWFYKILARFWVKAEYKEGKLLSQFENLMNASQIIWLDVDPCVCYQRKQSFTKCELGLLDGETGGSLSSFINYQSKIRDAYWDIFNKIKVEVHTLSGEITLTNIMGILGGDN